MELRKYEIEVLEIMLSEKFNTDEINSIIKSPVTDYHYTGSGYFVELSNDILPVDRLVISEPILFGIANEFNVGFVVYVENSKLALECHSWGIANPPENMRDKQIEIIELNEQKLKLNGVYSISNNKEVHIIEFEAIDEINDLEISQITQVLDGQERVNWQAPYDEKYFDQTNQLIGDWMDEPESIKKGEKFVFFFHELNSNKPIRTQFGDYEISEIKQPPNWLKEIMKYEEP